MADQGRTLRYVVVYEQAPKNWAAYVPDLPGCVATAKTREQMRQRIRDGIALYIESLQEDGEPVPEPGTWAEVLDIDLPQATEASQAKLGRRS